MNNDELIDFENFKHFIKEWKRSGEEKIIITTNIVLNLVNKIDKQTVKLEKKDKYIDKLEEKLNAIETYYDISDLEEMIKNDK